jgi:hypothetical protein
LTLGATELRAQATARGAELTALAQRVCLRTGPPRRLLLWAERWRATALAVPPVRSPEDRALRADLARYRAAAGRWEQARVSGSVSPALHRAWQRAEHQVRARTRRLPGSVRGGGPDALDTDALFAALGDGVLVELIDIDGYLHALVGRAGRVRRYPVGPVADAATETGYAHAALRRIARTGDGDGLDPVAQRLADVLLGPAQRVLDGRPVVVVPPGHLHGVPWGLLPSLRDNAFSVAPSARAWLRARTAPEPAGRAVVLVRGPGLHSGGAEIPAIAGLYERPTVLEHGAAKAGPVLAALDGSWLAHIAAHGTFRADSPLFSALRLADGPLTGYDLETLDTAPYRLILPSCDSARLAPVGADELLGLAAALLPSGTAGIVAPVVAVHDEATVALMRAFHTALRGGATMAAALAGCRTAAAGDPLATATACSFLAIGAA